MLNFNQHQSMSVFLNSGQKLRIPFALSKTVSSLEVPIVKPSFRHGHNPGGEANEFEADADFWQFKAEQWSKEATRVGNWRDFRNGKGFRWDFRNDFSGISVGFL